MTDKARLHQLVEELPEGRAAAAERFLQVLATEDEAEGMTPEDRAWLDADLSRLSEHEPYDWGPEGPPRGKPIRYVAGMGLVIIEDSDNE